MRKQRKVTMTVAALSVAGLMLAGCSGGGSDGAGGGDDLVYGTTTVPNNLDPHKTLFSADCIELCAIYDRLVHLQPDGTLVAGLAESWTFEDGGKALVLKIRDGVTFSDGTKLDSKGVKANLDRARGLDDSAVKTDLAAISAVDTPDASTVRISLSTPNAALPGVLSGLAGAIINPTALEDGTDLSKSPDGAGPYRFVSYRTGSELVLERNPDYWGDAPKISGLEFRFIPDPAALANALRSGQVDAAQIAPQNLKPFEQSDKFTSKQITTLYQTAIITNFQRAGLTDARVRQALLMAIDRETLCEQVSDGYCEVSDQPFPKDYWAHDGAVDEVLYPYDAAKAKTLLADAGATGLSITALVPGQQFMQLAQAVQEQLKAVGVTLKLQLVDGSAMAQQMFVDKTADAVITAFGGRPDPSQMFGARYSEAGFYNPGGFTTPTMQKLYEESLATTDENARTPILQAGSREVAKSSIGMMLSFPTYVYVMRKGVDIEPYVTGNPEFRTASVEG